MIRTFIDTLYSIAIGLGFTNFPKNPLDDLVSVSLFLVTIFLSAGDWYYHREFEKKITKKCLQLYYSVQIFSVLILSQLFVHSTEKTLSLWLEYFLAFVLLGGIWNLVAPINNKWGFSLGNIAIIFLSAMILVYKVQLMSLFSLNDFKILILLALPVMLTIYLTCIYLGSLYRKEV